MIQSFGTKFFKSITETADKIGTRFEHLFGNFSNEITGNFLFFIKFFFRIFKLY